MVLTRTISNNINKTINPTPQYKLCVEKTTMHQNIPPVGTRTTKFLYALIYAHCVSRYSRTCTETCFQNCVI